MSDPSSTDPLQRRKSVRFHDGPQGPVSPSEKCNPSTTFTTIKSILKPDRAAISSSGPADQPQTNTRQTSQEPKLSDPNFTRIWQEGNVVYYSITVENVLSYTAGRSSLPAEEWNQLVTEAHKIMARESSIEEANEKLVYGCCHVDKLVEEGKR